jgi:hypothetical protein
MKTTLNSTNKGIGLDNKRSKQKLYCLKYNSTLKFNILKEEKRKLSKRKYIQSIKLDVLKKAKDALRKQLHCKKTYNKRKLERSENLEIINKKQKIDDNNNNDVILSPNNNTKKKKLLSLVLKWDFDNPCKK